MVKLIVGLGNPGPEYEQSRHNAGFEVIERLATTAGAQPGVNRKLHCQVCRVQLVGRDVLLAKPITYMNLSGRSVAETLRWYRIELCDLLVIHDDVSLPLGRIRLQKAGGAGGQHGVDSIIEHLGGRQEFDRLKIGVGPDPGGDRRAGYVLSAVPPEQAELFGRVVALSCQATLCWLGDGVEVAMNRFNGLNLDVDEPRSAGSGGAGDMFEMPDHG